MAVITVTTKGQIIGLNDDLMVLLSNDDAAEVVRASRTDGTWTVHADGQGDTTATNRGDAIGAMVAHAQTATGADNYTAQIQPGLADLP